MNYHLKLNIRNMFEGIFFKTLKGSNGWSSLKLNKLDVTLIKDVHYHKRLFRIFDRNKPYTLTIKYTLSIHSQNPRDTIMQFDHVITKRYETEEGVHDEILDILDLQKQIKGLKEIHRHELLAKLKEYQ